jgi:hypothetical protein
MGLLQVTFRSPGSQISPLGHFKNIGETQTLNRCQYLVYAYVPRELSVKGGSYQSHRLFIGFNGFKGIGIGMFSLERADSHTLAAVNTAVLKNMSLTVNDSDSLGGTSFNAVGTALTLVQVKCYGMVIGLIHWLRLPGKV